MKRKICSLLLCVAMAVGLLAGCGDGNGDSAGDISGDNDNQESGNDSDSADDKTDSEEIITINMCTFGWGNVSDYKLVQDAINEISREEIGVEVNLTMLDVSQWVEQQSLLMSGSEPIDLLYSSGSIATGVSQGTWMELDDLYEEYGQGIAQELDQEFLEASRINGHIYGIPCQGEFANARTIAYRKDIVEELGLDVSNVKTLDDWVPIMEAVKEAYPDMDGFATNSGSSQAQWLGYNWDSLTDNFGVLMDYGAEATVVNVYETEEYENLVRTMRAWYEAGYVAKDTATETESINSLLGAGRVFSTIGTGKPGDEEESTNGAGVPIGHIDLTEALSVTTNITGEMWGITSWSEEPEAAMKFLNLMYSNEEVATLLNYGIEGVHYSVQEDGSFNYLEGQDITSCTYHPQILMFWPNSFIGGFWDGDDPNCPEETKVFNEEARKSIALGFSYDNANVINEVAACQNVVQQYQIALDAGAVDVDTVLPEFRQALKDAGIDKIIAEKQSQLDDWMAQKGE